MLDNRAGKIDSLIFTKSISIQMLSIKGMREIAVL